MRKIALFFFIVMIAGAASAQTANETVEALEDARSDIKAMEKADIPTERVENLLETANNSYRAQKNFEQEGGTADYSRAMELTERIDEIQDQALEASDRIEALENRLSELEGTSVNLSEARSHLEAAKTDFQEQRFEEVGEDIDASYSSISEAQSAQTQIESFAAAQQEGIRSWIQSGIDRIRNNPLKVAGGLASTLLLLWLSIREIRTYHLLKTRRQKQIKRDVLDDLIQDIQKDYYMKKEGSHVRFETKHEKFEELRRDTVQDIDVLEEKLEGRWSLLMDPHGAITDETEDLDADDIEFIDEEEEEADTGTEEVSEDEGEQEIEDADAVEVIGSEDDEESGTKEEGDKDHEEEDKEDSDEEEESEEEEKDDEGSTDEETFTCEECGREFGTERGLHIHQTQSHEGGGYTCEKCGEEFDTKRGLHIHEGMKHDDADGVECPDCGRTFDTERGMHIHRGEVHKD